MKNFFIITLFFALSFISYSQEGAIKGTITFKGKPMEAVSVYITGLNMGAATNSDGFYEIKNIPEGTRKIIVSSVGFKTRQKEVAITKEGTTTVDFKMVEDVLGLDQVVISATRTHLNRKLAPVIVTVTDSKLLESVQALSLSEGLSFQPGLRFETNCQNCGYSQVRINGLDGGYSQILINSKPVFSALAGLYGLDQIPANTIDRVEVIRGGGSALYGANAIAGTINIITKDPTDNTFQAGTSLAMIKGSSPDASAFVNGTVVTSDLDAGLSFFGMYRKRSPYDYDKDSFSEVTKMNSKSFGAKGFFNPNERSRLSAELTVLKEFRRGGNKFNLLPFQSDVTEQIDSDVLLAGFTYENTNESKNRILSFYASGSMSENENYYGDVAGADEKLDDLKKDVKNVNIESVAGILNFGNSKDNIIVLGGQYVYKFDKTEHKDVFTGGVEYKYNKTNDIKKAAGININQTLKTYGIYSQYEWVVSEKFRLLGGLRADFHNLLKDESVVLSPRINAMFSPVKDFRIRVSYAKGFRAPQFFVDDLHVQIAQGDLRRVQLAPNLVSETSHSFTASFDWSKDYESGKQISLTLEPFYTLLDKPFILEDVTGVKGVKEKRNGDSATLIGANFEAKYTPNEKFIFQLGTTYQNSKYKKPVELGDGEKGETVSSDKFLRSPNIYGNFVATYAPTKEFQNNLSGVITGSMYVDHVLGEKIYKGEKIEEAHRIEKTPSFFELNWKSSYNFSLDDHDHLKLQINGGVQNILDSYQQDFDKGAERDPAYVYGPSRPRTFFIGLKVGTNL